NQIQLWKKNDYVLSISRFSDPPRLQDLDSLEFDSRDLDAIRSCRPGNCDLKLSANEMTQLRQGSKEGDSRAVQEKLRQIYVIRLRQYLTYGQIPPNEDHHIPVQPSSSFESLLQHTPFLTERLPQLTEVLGGRSLRNHPGFESFFYWSKERIARQAV